jgi:hypothetical protein
MNRTVGRRYLPVVLMASSLAIASACSSSAGPTAAPAPTAGSPSSGTPSVAPTAPAAAAPVVPVAPAAEAGALSISDGGADLTVGTATVHLPSTATDVAWSPDGSEIAYIDADGNVAVASWDGSGVQVLTKTDASVLRAQPEWLNRGATVVFSERDSKGVWNLNAVYPGTRMLNSSIPPLLEVGGLFQTSHHDHSASTAYQAGPGGTEGHDLMVWQHDATVGAQVWIVDHNQREAENVFLVAGAEPALSPDGKSVAYVGKNGQLYVTSATKSSKPVSTQITFGLKGIVHPVWTPDGTRVTFATATDIESVSTKLAPGVTTNKPTVLSPKPGVPSYVSLSATTVSRLTGADPIADSIAVSKQLWNVNNTKLNAPNEIDSSVSAVTLVSAADPTVLAHIAALGRNLGPVLFTDGKTLDPRTAAEIKRTLGKPAYAGQGLVIKIYGGTDVMSPAIQTAAAKLGYPVSRTTGVATKQILFNSVIVVSDTDQAALANLIHLYQDNRVVLVHGATLTTAQQALFRSSGNGSALKVYVAGADARTAVAASWTRKPTNMQIIDLPTSLPDESVMFQPYFMNSVTLVAADDWESMTLANLGAVTVIVVDKDGTLSAAAVTWLRANAATIDTVNAYGSTSNVSAATLASAVAAVSGPAGSKS